MRSSLPPDSMTTVPAAAPPPLGAGPHALPHSPMTQSARRGVALQRPANVGVDVEVTGAGADAAAAAAAGSDPETVHVVRTMRNRSSVSRRMADNLPTREQ